MVSCARRRTDGTGQSTGREAIEMTTRSALLPWAAAALLVAAACDDGEQRLPPTQTNNNNNTTNNSSGADAGADADSGVAVDAGTPDSGTVTPTSEVQTLEVGTVTLGANGESGEVTFDLPQGATSFMLTVSGPDTATFIIKRMSGPGGEVLVSDDASNVSQIEMFVLGPFAAQFKSPNRVVQDIGKAAFMFPNNPSVMITGGTYTMELVGLTISGNQGIPLSGDVEVLIQYRTVEPSAGLLPVTLHFTGAGGITADSAPTDSLIQDALVRLGEIYAQAGITIGEVEYRDADAAYRTLPTGDGTLGDLERMFMTTAGARPGLHFFMVDRFEGQFGGGVAGIAGGLPGPASATGSPNSGVAVALSAIMGDAGVLAHVMAHEGGHWLGLFHTSEFTGTADQMPDTPEGQGGENHLMYPAVGGGTTLSPSQCDVLRRHMETIAQ